MVQPRKDRRHAAGGVAAACRYAPHAGQQRFHASAARWRVAACGRRWGKTLALAGDLLDAAGHVRGDYAWIGPTYQIVERGVDAFRTIAHPSICSLGGNSPRVARVLGSRVFFLSADQPDYIRGYGFRGIVIDEAAYVDADAWHYAIRPTLSDQRGWAAIATTPKGRNWVFDLWTRGQSGEPDYASLCLPSNSNPFFSPEEWAEARASLPDAVFRQEYQAEFLEDSAGVFRGIDACLLLVAPGEHATIRQPILGVDLAKHRDWTVLVLLDGATGDCHAIDRFNQLDWPAQKARIAETATRHRARVYLDATGVGDPIYDDLRACGLTVEGVKLTQQSKTALVQGLMLAIEGARVRWPAAWDVLTAELRRYEYEYTPKGGLSYNAPSGYHDDCVIALALAVQGAGFGRPRGGLAIPGTRMVG